MVDLDTLVIENALGYVETSYKSDLKKFIYGETEHVQAPLLDTDYTLVCDTTSGTEFGESEIKVFDGNDEIARCVYVNECHYEWEVDFGYRGSGLGNIVRTIAEAHDGMLEGEYVSEPTLIASLYKRGYDPVGIHPDDVEIGIEYGTIEGPIALTLNEERAISFFQKYNAKTDMGDE